MGKEGIKNEAPGINNYTLTPHLCPHYIYTSLPTIIKFILSERSNVDRFCSFAERQQAEMLMREIKMLRVEKCWLKIATPVNNPNFYSSNKVFIST